MGALDSALRSERLPQDTPDGDGGGIVGSTVVF